MKMNTKEQIFIIKQYETSSRSFPTIKFEMPESSSLEDVIEAFETFLIGVTFELPKGARLGLVYDEETEKENVEKKYSIDLAKQSMSDSITTSSWPDTWTLSHPISTQPIGSIIPNTSFTTSVSSDKPVIAKKKKKNGKRKGKSSSKR